MVGQGDVLPYGVVGAPVSDLHAEPRGLTEVAMLRLPAIADEDTCSDVGEREIRDWVAAGFVEKDHVLAVGDPLASELDSHTSAQGLCEQQSSRKRVGGE